MFGRPPRDTGRESERNNKSSAAQRLHLLNSGHVQRKIEQGGKIRYLLQSRRDPGQTVQLLYLTILSRFPTKKELQTIAGFAKGRKGAREAGVDLAWALINSAEFLYRH